MLMAAQKGSNSCNFHLGFIRKSIYFSNNFEHVKLRNMDACYSQMCIIENQLS